MFHDEGASLLNSVKTVVVVSHKKDWPETIPNIKVITALEYLMGPEFQDAKRIRLYNLCRSYRYQSNGYYVSLLAQARGHKPIPTIETIEDFRSPFLFRTLTDEFDKLIQKDLSHIKSEEFALSIYFGKNVSRRYDRLSLIFYQSFKVPLIRVQFKFHKGKWHLKDIFPLAYKDVPESHKFLMLEAAQSYFERPDSKTFKKINFRYDLAILTNPTDPASPSNAKAIEKFIKAGNKLGLNVQLITKSDFSKIPTFDALFIRETTNVNHYTFRFSRRAEMEGLAVIDDAQSILRCSNKVFLDEILKKNKIPRPKTYIINSENINLPLENFQFPYVLKEPDSSFSRGVIKAENKNDYLMKVEKILEKSDLVIVQEFLPTDYDWRIGILDNKVLYVCKYFMAKNHWQIVKNDPLKGSIEEGMSRSMPVSEAPPDLLQMALKSTKLIGNGLYGVDIKEVQGKYYLIEINDNPNIDSGVEDSIIKNQLYEEIMQSFVNRIEKIKDKDKEKENI